MTWVLAILIRPFAAFFLLACVLLPIRFAVKAWFPEGMIKRLLLLRVDYAGQRERAGRQ